MGCNQCNGTGITVLKTLVIGSDDIIVVDISFPNRNYDLTPFFVPGGDVIACIQNADGQTCSQLSWSATGGNFPNTIVPASPQCGSFQINVPRTASSGWAPNDSADINVELRTPDGGKRILILSGVIAIVQPTVAGLP